MNYGDRFGFSVLSMGLFLSIIASDVTSNGSVVLFPVGLISSVTRCHFFVVLRLCCVLITRKARILIAVRSW